MISLKNQRKLKMPLERKPDKTEFEYEDRCKDSRRMWIEAEEEMRRESRMTSSYRTYFIYFPSSEKIKIGESTRLGKTRKETLALIKHSVFYKLDGDFIMKNMKFVGIICGRKEDYFKEKYEKLHMGKGWFKARPGLINEIQQEVNLENERIESLENELNNG